MEKNIALTQRESYTPSLFTEFLWWLSTAEKEILIDAEIDRNRYKIIGMSVLATWLFATLAWAYFFSIVVSSFTISIFLGFFMGFIILTIDRTLIKGITKTNKHKFLPLLFRGLMALTIGFFMAQPAILYMFNKEIKLQTSLDNEQKKISKRHELDTLYAYQLATLQTQKNSLQQTLTQKYDEVQKARENFLAESDGSGGTGKVGIKDIALAKKAEYEKLDAEYQLMAKNILPKIDSSDATVKKINNAIIAEEAVFAGYFNDGFLTRIEALNNLIKNNNALQMRYYLIVCILMLIELMPVIAKTILPVGSYDEKVTLREEMEREVARGNIKQEQQLKEYYNQMAFENNKETINIFFTITQKDKEEKIKAYSQNWKDENHQAFDGLWEKIKKAIVAKQEN
ncbi:MAG TPA: DUF4407 domain-containing protein [Ferruginibacter sp.]|nr:DUF4407 domain-containing protein [Ferruginibacter sp.]